MGQRIKRPDLASVAPPFFEVHRGHSVKVLESDRRQSDQSIWVKVLLVQGDELLGIVTSPDLSSEPHHLRRRDVIEFRHCHIFGLF